MQQEIPALRFALAHQDLFPFNASFYAHLQNISDTCGYTTYLDDFVKYPPEGLLPLVGNREGSTRVSDECAIWDEVYNEVFR